MVDEKIHSEYFKVEKENDSAKDLEWQWERGVDSIGNLFHVKLILHVSALVVACLFFLALFNKNFNWT